MQKPVVIVNPRSGGGLTERRWAQLVGPLAEGLGSFDTRFTERAGDGRRLAAEESAAGRTLVVALGGDGTISEVADGVLASGKPVDLGIIPHGTGGDFRRTLDLPEDIREAGRRVRDSAARVVDAGKVTFSTGVRHFVNVASFGFSAEVASRANRSSKSFGAKAAFLGATLRALASHDNADLFVSVDGAAGRRMTVLLGAVGNGRFFGGGMKICPDSRLDDGLLDLVTVGDLGRVEILAKIHRLYAGTHLTMDDVQLTRGRSIVVTPADGRTIPVEIDGETPGTLPATFEIVPGALRLRA